MSQLITKEEYYVLRAIKAAFESDFHQNGSNLIWLGTDGKGARSIADAFANWKLESGKWNCTGLGSKLDPDLVDEFSKIVQDYRNRNTQTGKTNE
jgi:hypothetical protein